MNIETMLTTGTNWGDESARVNKNNTAIVEKILSSGIQPIGYHEFASNPVLTGASVTDRTAVGVADPFICFEGGMYHMFFEVITATTQDIGHATSPDGLVWTYDQIVLTSVGQHFAYPLVFKIGADWYMLPDMTTKLVLYKATTFPTVWEVERTFSASGEYVDATPFFYNDVWYVHIRQGTVVNLYFCDDILTDALSLHPSSPIMDAVGGVTIGARGGGKPIVDKDKILMPVQGYWTSYGEFTKWYLLTNLTKTTCTVVPGPIFQQRGDDWCDRGQHHFDGVLGSDYSIAVSDGIDSTGTNVWSIAVRRIGGIDDLFCQARSTSTIELAATTWTTLPLNTLIFDNGGIWNNAGDKLIIQKSGWYDVHYNVCFYNITSARYIRARLWVNGTTQLLPLSKLAAAGGAGSHHDISISKALYLTAGQEIELQVYTSIASTYTFPDDLGLYVQIKKIRC